MPNARACREIAVRPRLLSVQANHHVQNLAQIGRHLEEAVAVLPPHHTPRTAPRSPACWHHARDRSTFGHHRVRATTTAPWSRPCPAPNSLRWKALPW